MAIRALGKELEELKDNTVARKSAPERSLWSKGCEYALIFHQDLLKTPIVELGEQNREPQICSAAMDGSNIQQSKVL